MHAFPPCLKAYNVQNLKSREHNYVTHQDLLRAVKEQHHLAVITHLQFVNKQEMLCKHLAALRLLLQYVSSHVTLQVSNGPAHAVWLCQRAPGAHTSLGNPWNVENAALKGQRVALRQ